MSTGSDDPCRVRESAADDGARITGYDHGGHITGWWPAGHSTSRLWMSPVATCAPGAALRGGIPVVFPQFGTLGPLRKHGFVRDVAWRCVEPALSSDASGATGADHARLVVETQVGPTDDWPHEARVMLTASARGSTLEVRLDVHNVGATTLSFTAALHTYLTVDEPGSVVAGLGGISATDALNDGTSATLTDGVATDAGMDLLVRGVGSRPVTVVGPSGPLVTMGATGFTDRVVWNPGPANTLADVPPGAHADFVCVEPAMLSPVTTEPGQRWTGLMSLRSLVAASGQG